MSASTIESFRALMFPPPELALAEHELVRRCMAARGFRYLVPVPPASSEGSTSLLQLPPQLKVAEARVNGYGIALRRAPSVPGDTPEDAEQRYLESLSPQEQDQYQHALDGGHGARQVEVTLPGGARVGASTEGCVGEARQKLYGSLQSYLTVLYLPQVAQSEITAVEDDRALRNALEQYASCMSDQGYGEADTPAAARERAESYYADGETPAARRREIALATADAECQEQTQVYEALKEAVDRVAAEWLQENEGAVLAATEAQRAAVSRARNVLRGDA